MSIEIYKIEKDGKFAEYSYPDFERACWVWSEDQDAQVVEENLATHEQRRISREECLRQLRKCPAPSLR